MQLADAGKCAVLQWFYEKKITIARNIKEFNEMLIFFLWNFGQLSRKSSFPLEIGLIWDYFIKKGLFKSLNSKKEIS